MESEGLTPTQQRLFQMLSSGKLRTTEELKTCLLNKSKNLSPLYRHICIIRSKIRPRGLDIVFVSKPRGGYQLVRLLANPYDGRS